MDRRFIDIHVHPSLKPYNNFCYEGIQPTMWEAFPYDENWQDPARFLSRFVRKGIREIVRRSQSNLSACGDSNIGCVFLSLYPTERPFFDPKPRNCLVRLFLPKKKIKYLAQSVSGFPIRKIEKIMDRVAGGRGIDYFHEELLPLLHYVFSQIGDAPGESSKHSFKMAPNYKEFKKIIQNEKDTTAGILTIEGANSLGSYKKNDLFKKEYEELSAGEKSALRKGFEDNIESLKNHKNSPDITPFFITFCHHFNNLLAGHSRSLSAGMRQILHQDIGMNRTFNSLGRKVLELLLDKTNGRRILIDTKHMSLRARMDYHRYIFNKTRNGDKIPIICSHAAINGWKSFAEAEKFGSKKKIDKKTYFSCWEINLNDEEILDIYETDGMIGIVLHEGRMPGGILRKRIKAIKDDIAEGNRSNKRGFKSVEELEKVYLEMIWSNIFHIIRLIANRKKSHGNEEANGWKLITLGSDFDGVIDALDSFSDVSKLPVLADRMIEYIQDKKNPVYYAENGSHFEFDREELENLLFGRSVEKIVEDLFFNNVDTFLSKYFTTSYLS